MKFAADFRKLARNALRGKWAMAVIVCLLASLLGGTGGGPEMELERENDKTVFQVTYAGNVVFSSDNFKPSAAVVAGVAFYALLGALFYLALSLFLGSVIGLGYAKFHLNLIDGQNAEYANLFSYFSHWKNAVDARFMKGLYIFLWSLLLIIPGIVASYSYAMVEFLQAEDPSLSGQEALAKSTELMRGNRWRLFCMEFSFIGWQLLSALVWGIGELWINPYMGSAKAAFYREISDTWTSQDAFAEPVSDPETVG